MHHKNYRSEKTCLNCSAIVERKFCPECGQENIEVRESFLSMINHFFSDYFHFDSKFFRSLSLLLFKPGFLTAQYWSGKRQTFIHPLRFFFFITIIFMISTSFFYQKFGEQFKDRLIERGTQLDTTAWSGLKLTDKIYWSTKADSITMEKARVEMKRSEHELQELRSGLDDVFKNLKYITFLLLPIYAIIFPVLYFRSGKFYTEHVVYMLHLQSFMYCLFSVTLILPFIFPIDIDAIRHISVWTMMIYIWISLHVLYKQRWWITSLKTFVAATFIIFTTQLSVIFFAFLLR